MSVRKIIAWVLGAAIVVATGVVVWTVVGNGEPPRECRNGYVALTFDDGPSPTTQKLLAALKRYHLRATFFDIGEYVAADPHMARETMLYGNEVDNHTWDHRSFTGETHHTVPLSPSAQRDELTRTRTVITKMTGHYPRYWRSPYGDTSTSAQQLAAGLGMTEVGWTVDSRDYDGISASEIVHNVQGLRPGGVVVLHDTAKVHTIDAIAGIARWLDHKGLCAGRLAPSQIGTKGWEHGVFYVRPVSWETQYARQPAGTTTRGNP